LKITWGNKLEKKLSSGFSSQVSLIKCSDYDLALLKQKIYLALELIGGVNKFIQKGMKVLIKPNIMMPKKYGFPANTHPLFLKAVIQIFKESGAQITVGESSAGSQAGVTFTKKALKISGTEEVAETEGVKLVNFDFDQVCLTEIKNPHVHSIPIAKTVFEADLVVSLPKLKTHTFANIITGAIKNIYGVIPGQIKAEYHRLAPRPEQFFTIIRDLFGVVRPGLTIFDAIEGMEGDGPSAGEARQIGYIIASEDAVAADAVATELINVPSMKVLTTRLCAEAGLGKGKMEEITVLGEDLEKSVIKNFKLPTTTVYNPYLYRLILTLTKTEPFINQKKCTLCKVCLDSCPMRAIALSDKTLLINRSQCIRCFCCSETCPHQAIKPRRKNFLGNVLSKIILSRW
jgi:uncharacterized protein (DUF362 family)/Pyruvate/2-oxoacid:ferredoxin oxidoreductase delta subunit